MFGRHKRRLPRGRAPRGTHVPPEAARPLTPEEQFAQDSDRWFARMVTAAMDRHRQGIRNPSQAESEYDVHGWGADYRIHDF